MLRYAMAVWAVTAIGCSKPPDRIYFEQVLNQKQPEIRKILGEPNEKHSEYVEGIGEFGSDTYDVSIGSEITARAAVFYDATGTVNRVEVSKFKGRDATPDKIKILLGNVPCVVKFIDSPEVGLVGDVGPCPKP